MKATLDCLECIAAQALRAARVATSDPELQREVLNSVLKEIPGLELSKSPAELSLLVYELTAAMTGNYDPYSGLKHSQNELALAMEMDLRELVEDSTDHLVTALHLAAAGNVIDLGIRHTEEIDVWAEVRNVMQERFSIDHTEVLRKSLATCKDLVYLLDNAGEIVFDKILIEELQKYTAVTAVVKAGPMINDALLQDAEQVGLTRLCDVIDNGGAFVGSPLDLVPKTFLDRLHRADIIIGKGQGNYETLDEFPGNVFLLLKAKCRIISRHMGVEYGQVALISNRELQRLREAEAARNTAG